MRRLCRTVNVFKVNKGSEFTTSVSKAETDLTADMIASLVCFFFCIASVVLLLIVFMHTCILPRVPLTEVRGKTRPLRRTTSTL